MLTRNVDEPSNESASSDARVQLASVRLLVQTEREVDIGDIMLATIFEEIESGPKSTEELLKRVRASWPGVSITRSMIDATMNAARERRLTDVIVQLDGQSSWGLASMGRDELELSKNWANDVMERTALQLQLDAQNSFAQVSSDSAMGWAAILFQVLMWGIARAFTDGEGGIKVVNDRFLFPDAYDLNAMNFKLAESCSDPEVLHFLRMELRSALDPSTTFATELVHYVATGYVLYSYLGHRDHHEARTLVGTFSKEKVLLDTPMLIQLLSDRDGSRATQEILQIAIRQGVKVLVEPSTLEELRRVVESRTEEAQEIEGSMNSGADLITLRTTINDQILSVWLNSSPTAGGQFVSWTDFQLRTNELEVKLQTMGVDCSGESNWTLAMSGEHARLKAALNEDLGARVRGDWNLDHDARLLTIARRERELNPDGPSKLWPGAIIITSDTHMNAAFVQVFGVQSFPVALSVSQWAGLLGSFSPPVNAERLAIALTEEIPRRTVLKNAIQIPTATAIELARSLSFSDIHQNEVEDIQLSLQEILQQTPRNIALSRDDARELAIRALARRNQRATRAAKEMRENSRVAQEQQFERFGQKLASIQSESKLTAGVIGENDKRITLLETRNRQLKRGLSVLIVAILIGIVILILKSLGLEKGHKFGLSLVGLVLLIGSGIDYSVKTERPWYELLGGIIFSIALAVLPIFL
ncbi:MAG: hypothetical protein ACYC1I_12050 [Acidimicrobiales bacterium]